MGFEIILEEKKTGDYYHNFNEFNKKYSQINNWVSVNKGNFDMRLQGTYHSNFYVHYSTPKWKTFFHCLLTFTPKNCETKSICFVFKNSEIHFTKRCKYITCKSNKENNKQHSKDLEYWEKFCKSKNYYLVFFANKLNECKFEDLWEKRVLVCDEKCFDALLKSICARYF